LKVSYVQGEDAVFAEFTAGATVISAGRHYQQDYILDLCAEAGKIAVFREYYDALRVVAALQPGRGSWAALTAIGVGAFALVTTEFLPVGLLPQIAGDMGVTAVVKKRSAGMAAPGAKQPLVRKHNI
jgi:hypothetical protein